MTIETSNALTGINVAKSGNGSANPGDASGVVHRVAQRAHDTVDKLEQTVVSGSDRVYSMTDEYGSYAREQIKTHPLGIVAGAFVVGLLLGKILR